MSNIKKIKLATNIEYFGSAVERVLSILPGEKVIAPAIRLDDGRIFYVLPITNPTKSDPPTTYKRVEAHALLGGHVGDFHRDQMGFLTSKNRWVRPRHAAKIAASAGQMVNPLRDTKIGLQPADLWS